MRISRLASSMVIAVAALALSMPKAAVSSDAGSPSGNMQQQERMDPPASQTDTPVNGTADRRGQVQDPPQAAADTRQEAEDTVLAATRIFTHMLTDAKEPIPAAVIDGAAGIAIFPEVIRAGLIAGGRYGTGVLLSQNQGQWSAPVFVSIGGASLGAQIGVEASDLILVFRTQDALNTIIDGDDFRLGVDASIAAGSSGARAQMTTQDAEIWAYQRNRGLFAGVAVSGAILTLNDERLRAYYDFPEDQTARGYQPEEEQAARTLLGIGPQQDRQIVEQMPPSAEALRKTIKDAGSSGQ
jgi:lipid-binding SYLF domain-containing protein